jgi:AcrR family transcriptional regulator
MNKEQILEVAAQIIRQKGFHATSMQDIADAVSLQKASLYHHVASKQEILLELLDQALDLITESVTQVIRQDISPQEKICQACRVYLSALANRSDVVSVLLLEHRSLEPKYRARHIPRRDRFEVLWREMIQEGIDAGVFCKTADIPLTARALLGNLNWTITWYKPNGPLSTDQIADHISSLFMEGLRCRPEKE